MVFLKQVYYQMIFVSSSNNKWMYDEILNARSIFRIYNQTLLHEVLKIQAPFFRFCQIRLRTGSYFLYNCEDSKLGKRRFVLSKLYRSNPNRPNICLIVVFAVVQHFWAHPKRRSNLALFARISISKLSRNSKVNQLRLAIRCQQDVVRLHISVNHFQGVNKT